MQSVCCEDQVICESPHLSAWLLLCIQMCVTIVLTKACILSMEVIKFCCQLPIFNFLSKNCVFTSFSFHKYLEFCLFWISFTFKHKFYVWSLALPLSFVMYQTEKNCFHSHCKKCIRQNGITFPCVKNWKGIKLFHKANVYIPLL